MASFLDLPAELKLQVLGYLDIGTQSVLASRFRDTHDIAMVTLHRSVGPLRLDRLHREPMTLHYVKEYAKYIKRLAIHFHMVKDCDILLQYQQDLKEIFAFLGQIEVFAFTAFEFLDEEAYQTLEKFLRKQELLSLVVLPKLDRGAGPHLKEDVRSPLGAIIEVSTSMKKNLKIFIKRTADLDVAKSIIDRSRQKIVSASLFGHNNLSPAHIRFFCSRIGLHIPVDLPKLKFYNFDCSILFGLLLHINIQELRLENCSDEAYFNSLRHQSPNMKSLHYRSTVYTKRYQGKFISLDTLRNLSDCMNGLQTQCIHHSDNLPDGLSIFANQHANTLERASYRFGTDDATLQDLKNLAKAAQNLQALAFNWKMALVPLVSRCIPSEFKTSIDDVAHALADAKNIRTLAFFTETLVERYNSDDLDILKQAMRIIISSLKDVGILAEIIHILPRDITYSRRREDPLPSPISFRISRRNGISVSQIIEMSLEEKEDLDALGGGSELWMQHVENAEMGDLYYSDKKLSDIRYEQKVLDL